MGIQMIDRLKQAFVVPIRQLLFVNNLILALCSIVLAGFSFLVCALFYQSSAANSVFTNWFALGVVGLSLTSICIIGMRGAHLVSLELLLFYFWGIAMFIGPLILGTVAGFGFIDYIEIWFKHSWEAPEFDEIRAYFCAPSTASNECKAPLYGGISFSNVDEWCLYNYNTTSCNDIRESAETDALRLARQLIITQAFISMFNVLQIALSIYICNKILTAPVITQSMNDTINYLLVLPIGGSFGVAAYTSWMKKFPKVLPMYWAPQMFLCLGIAMICQMPVGIAAARLKSRLMLTGSIFLLLLIVVGLITCGILCVLYAVAYESFTGFTRSAVVDIACTNDLLGCCCCHDDSVADRCPEWQNDEVISFLTVSLKVAGVIAFLSTIYYLGAVVVSELLRRNLANYKSGYI